MGLLTMDDGIGNWGEHTKVEETNHALMAISSSNEIKNYGMSSNSKVGLGFEIQSNNEVLSYEEEMNFSVFNCSKEDSVGKPLYSRFTKTNDVKGVLHPLSGDYTPTPQEEIDESLYVYGKKGSQEPEPNVSDDRSSEYSTCQSNDSAGSIGTSSEHSVDPEYEISSVTPEVYVSTPITTNEKVQLNAGRPNINSVMPNINTGRTNINSVRPKVNTGSSNVNTIRSRQPVPNNNSNSFSPKRPQVNQFNKRGQFSKSYSSVRRPFEKTTVQMSHSNAVKGNWRSAVKTSIGYNWRNSKPNFNCDSGPTFIRIDHPLKNMVDRGIFDSGCSGHMTGNKDQLEDFEEFNKGSVTFGGSKGYISGKGRIRVGNLEFDSVSFVKELGHFNLFSISQICDKQHKVLLKVPRHHNMYSFDMKTPTPAKGFACLIAKATSDESKLWHRRLGHINFKNLNKLVKGNLVRGLPSK
ncbi:ribonuclease H-like domain-containing protein, partial [Tanacetum coccineum]